MILVVTEKNDAAKQIARLLSQGKKPTQEAVYSTPTYRFQKDGEEWVCIGLRGHILQPDFTTELLFNERSGWYGLTEGNKKIVVDVPDGLSRPPYTTKRKPFLADGIDLKSWKTQSLPYLVWAPIIKNPAEKNIIRTLKNLAKKASEAIIATDFDREGELIGKDALEQILDAHPNLPLKRARFSAFIKEEIQEAFSELVDLDYALADAGESRQFIDLIWGAILTRYLTLARKSGFGNVRSAGRVQTPTLALVVERERERMAFKPEDYWVLGAQVICDETVLQTKHATGRFTNEQEALSAFKNAKNAKSACVVDITKKSRTQPAPTPFNTTSLQAAAAAEGLSPARTMRIAESLYMAGYITYPRVDNTVYPKSLNLKSCVKSLSSIPEYASVTEQLLKQSSLRATRGKVETTDHPPIYPTAPATPDKLEKDEWKLYNLIARRFLATLMDSAVLESTKITFDVNSEPFVVSGSVLVRPGFRAIYPYGLKKDELMPALELNAEYPCEEVSLEKKQTEPPARYSQGKLVQEMEKRGLGTKSTRASIIERLYAVKYLKNNPIEPSQLGIAIIEALSKFAPTITTPEMTASLEQSMNEVASGKDTLQNVVNHSRELLASMMDELLENQEALGESMSDAITADAKVGICPKCARDLVVKHSPKTRSSFVGCMGWPECDVTYPLPQGKIDAIELQEGLFKACSLCGAPMVKVKPFRSAMYETCINPQCKTNYEPDLSLGLCPVCKESGESHQLIAKKSQTSGKRFVRCENYEECKTSYPLPSRGTIHATGEFCEHCSAPVIDVETERGLWHTCINMQCPSKEKKSSARSRKARGKKSSK